MSSDRRVIDECHAKLKALVERKASGQRAAATDRRMNVVKQQGRRAKMLGPRDGFWEVAKYRRTFGLPSAGENNKRRHKRTVYHGREGVMPPHDQTQISRQHGLNR